MKCFRRLVAALLVFTLLHSLGDGLGLRPALAAGSADPLGLLPSWAALLDGDLSPANPPDPLAGLMPRGRKVERTESAWVPNGNPHGAPPGQTDHVWNPLPVRRDGTSADRRPGMRFLVGALLVLAGYAIIHFADHIRLFWLETTKHEHVPYLTRERERFFSDPDTTYYIKVAGGFVAATGIILFVLGRG